MKDVLSKCSDLYSQRNGQHGEMFSRPIYDQETGKDNRLAIIRCLLQLKLLRAQQSGPEARLDSILDAICYLAMAAVIEGGRPYQPIALVGGKDDCSNHSCHNDVAASAT